MMHHFLLLLAAGTLLWAKDDDIMFGPAEKISKRVARQANDAPSSFSFNLSDINNALPDAAPINCDSIITAALINFFKSPDGIPHPVSTNKLNLKLNSRKKEIFLSVWTARQNLSAHHWHDNGIFTNCMREIYIYEVYVFNWYLIHFLG